MKNLTYLHLSIRQPKLLTDTKCFIYGISGSNTSERAETMRIDVLSFVVLFRVIKKLSVEIQYREVLDNNQSGFFNTFFFFVKARYKIICFFIVVAEVF